ncbi:MAG: hypothetical protein ACLSS9_01020 [Acutalibacteraceae bacterium]
MFSMEQKLQIVYYVSSITKTAGETGFRLNGNAVKEGMDGKGEVVLTRRVFCVTIYR